MGSTFRITSVLSVALTFLLAFLFLFKKRLIADIIAATRTLNYSVSDKVPYDSVRCDAEV